MKTIPLTKGKSTIVDNDMFKYLNQWKWCLMSSGNGYAATKYNKKIITMHRLLIHAPKGMEVDHINGNGLDNRICNLRICTRSQNQINKGLQKNNTTGYKGVSFIKKHRKYRATIRINGKSMYLGEFESAKGAAFAYDNKAKELFGNFAKLNFVEEPC